MKTPEKSSLRMVLSILKMRRAGRLALSSITCKRVRQATVCHFQLRKHLVSDDFPQQLEQIRMNSNNIYTSFFRCQSPSENSAVGKLYSTGGDTGHKS